jgi:hypothetical protein
MNVLCPGYVLLGLLDGPEVSLPIRALSNCTDFFSKVGGDTVFADTAMAYR